jgi:hypothetical protein
VLDHLRGGTSWTQPSGIYARMHTADPGSVGTANGSAVTTRVAVTFGVAAAGSIAQTGTAPAFTATASETIAYMSYWDALTGGNFLWSAQCAVPKGVVSGDVITQTTCTLSLAPLAA